MQWAACLRCASADFHGSTNRYEANGSYAYCRAKRHRIHGKGTAGVTKTHLLAHRALQGYGSTVCTPSFTDASAAEDACGGPVTMRMAVSDSSTGLAKAFVHALFPTARFMFGCEGWKLGPREIVGHPAAITLEGSERAMQFTTPLVFSEVTRCQTSQGERREVDVARGTPLRDGRRAL